jgi:hypothetical protein
MYRSHCRYAGVLRALLRTAKRLRGRNDLVREAIVRQSDRGMVNVEDVLSIAGARMRYAWLDWHSIPKSRSQQHRQFEIVRD